MVRKRQRREPVPFRARFPHLAPDPSGTPGEAGALNDEQNDKRGRPSRERGADNMIEQQRPSPERRKATAALDEARLRQQAIGVRLRQMFDEVVNEDVPDEFLDILRKADERNAGGGE
jgi:hypothetical protein